MFLVLFCLNILNEQDMQNKMGTINEYLFLIHVFWVHNVLNYSELNLLK